MSDHTFGRKYEFTYYYNKGFDDFDVFADSIKKVYTFYLQRPHPCIHRNLWRTTRIHLELFSFKNKTSKMTNVAPFHIAL